MARPSRFLRLPGHLWAAGAIIVAGLLAAGWSYRELQHTARGQAEANFLRKAVVLHARIADSLRRYDDALYSLRSAFALQGRRDPSRVPPPRPRPRRAQPRRAGV